MINASSIAPDEALRDFLQGRITVDSGSAAHNIPVFGDWEKPTNDLSPDFIVIYINGDIEGIGKKQDFARGYVIVSLYCKMNDDGSIKKNRIKKILAQFDSLLAPCKTGGYFFEYDTPRYITPTTPNQSSGYSITMLNLTWHTN